MTEEGDDSCIIMNPHNFLSCDESLRLVRALRLPAIDDGPSLSLSTQEPWILDIASGDGRVALGLANTGYSVLATDICQTELNKITEDETLGSLEVHTLRVSGVELKELSEPYRAITLAKALYLDKNWSKWLDRIYTLLSPKGRFAHQWAHGVEGDIVFDLLQQVLQLRIAMGIRSTYFEGTQSLAAVEKKLTDLGLQKVKSFKCGASTPKKLYDFIDRMAQKDSRGVSWLQGLNEEQKAEIKGKLLKWCEKEGYNDETYITHPVDPCWDIYEKP